MENAFLKSKPGPPGHPVSTGSAASFFMIDYKDLQESNLNDTYTLVSKLYTPSTINIEKELLFGLVSGRL